jgi:hypothetical protein
VSTVPTCVYTCANVYQCACVVVHFIVNLYIIILYSCVFCVPHTYPCFVYVCV